MNLQGPRAGYTGDASRTGSSGRILERNERRFSEHHGSPSDPYSGIGMGEGLVVSTFYVLPSRPLLGQRFAGYLKTLFPGLDWAGEAWPELAELIAAAVARHADVYIVHAEDLPDGDDLGRALTDGFGAEPGDEVIEVMPESRPGQVTARRWRLGDAA
ncbi:MAG TPA: hypothetical protein VG013_40830 [Gemmataceae bacterium]|nr:hypothetical protein [Gemmataceae bacterium]